MIPAYFSKSENVMTIKLKNSVTCMSWDHVKKCVFCGLDNGNIFIWHFD